MDNKAQTLQQCLDAVDMHNINAVRSLYSSDAQIDAPGAQLRGTDQIIAWYGVFVKVFPDIKHEVLGIVQDGDAYALQARATGTHTGPLASPAGDIPPTGKPFALDYLNVARFTYGHIASETYYWDNQAFLTQLGLA